MMGMEDLPKKLLFISREKVCWCKVSLIFDAAKKKWTCPVKRWWNWLVHK